MCGIAGQFLLDKSGAQNLLWFKDSVNVLKHRGPDSEGTFKSENLLLSHTRLAIQDLSSNAGQPFCDSNFALVFNGEIYNFQEIRDVLGEVKFKSLSDTEVLFEFLKKYGTAQITKLRGMFAFAFYDIRNNNLLLARDHTGQKPLYYGRQGSNFFFSSLSTHVAEATGTEVSLQGLRQYDALQFNFGGTTLFESVKELPPGYTLEIRDGKFTLARYWSPTPKFITQKVDYEYLEFLLMQAVRRTLISDVDVALTVSGGLDSSLVAGLANTMNTHTLFHGRYRGEAACDESAFASNQASFLNSSIKIVELSAEQFDSDFLPTIMALGLPTGGPGSVGQFAVAREIAKQAKVSIGGQGGDELFLGYARHYVLEPELWGSPILSNYAPMKDKLKEIPTESNKLQRYFHLLYRGTKGGHETKQYRETLKEFQTWVEDYCSNWKEMDGMSLASLIDQATFLPSLMHVEDGVTMHYGLESRTPFLDVDLIEYVNSLTQNTKISKGPKGMLKKISEKYVDPSILKRDDKMGFPVPLNDWINKGLLPTIRGYIPLTKGYEKWSREVWGEASKSAFLKRVNSIPNLEPRA